MKSPSKNSLLSKVLKALLAAAFILSITACPPATGGDPDPVPGPENKDPEPTKVEQLLLGTWAYDYGYDQEKFAEETLTLNTDKTFYIDAKYYYSNTFEIDKGTYEIINDAKYGQTLKMNITSFKNNTMTDFANVNVLLSFKCYFDDDDTMHLDRYKKDLTNQGGTAYEFDPPRENTYYRIKDGTKETLTSGKWRVNKIGTPDCDWDEEWTFNVDGTMKDVWTDSGAATETYDGTYEVIEKDGKNVLHHILDWETSQPEWWYEYKTLGPNLITVQLIESTKDGKVNNADINYYYREVETENFTYHFANYTLDQTVPKASSYTLTNHPWQLNDYPAVYAGYEIDFLGWYDNPECTGSKLTEAVGNKREYWAKTGVRIKAKEERDNGAYYYGNNDFTVKAFSDMKEISAKKGDTITVYFEATVSKDYDASMGLDLTDYTGASDFWTNCWHNVKSNNKKIQTTFTFNIDKDIHYENMDDIGFIFAINSSTKDDEILFTDIKFVFLDNTNSYNITYKFGDVSFETKGFSNTDFELAKDSNFFEHINWNIAHSIEILGWYENADFSGNAVTKIPAGNTADKTYYAKFNPKIRISSWTESNGSENHDYNTTLPVKALLPGKDFNPKAGDTISVYFEANISHDLNGWGGLRLVDETNGWDLIAQDWNEMKTDGKKLSKTFSIKIDENAKLPSIENLCFDFGYEKEAYDGIITFSDWKFVLLDETNSYKITYNFGDVSYVARGLKDSECKLPSDAKFFEHWSWYIAQQELLGWYDNPELTGTPVTSISAGNTADKTYYAKINLKGRRSGDWEDNGKMNHDYHSTVPAKVLFPETDFTPKPGDTINIYFEATLSHDLNQWAGLQLQADGLNFTDFGPIETKDKKLSKVFAIKIDDNVTVPSINDLYIDFWYSKEACDEIITFSDWKIVLLGDTNSYNIKLNYGNLISTVKGFIGKDYTLPSTYDQFYSINQRFAEQEIIGWYDNPEFTGTPVTSIAAGNTTDKEFWMKYNLKTCRRDWNDNGTPNHTWDSEIPLAAVIPDFDTSLLVANTTIKIKVTATPSNTSFDRYFLRLVDLTSTDGVHEGWKDIAWTEESDVLENNKLSHTFDLKIEEDATGSALKDILFGIGHSKTKFDQSITLSDWKFELVD